MSTIRVNEDVNEDVNEEVTEEVTEEVIQPTAVKTEECSPCVDYARGVELSKSLMGTYLKHNPEIRQRETSLHRDISLRSLKF